MKRILFLIVLITFMGLNVSAYAEEEYYKINVVGENLLLKSDKKALQVKVKTLQATIKALQATANDLYDRVNESETIDFRIEKIRQEHKTKRLAYVCLAVVACGVSYAVVVNASK